MGFYKGPQIVTNGLTFYLDAGNPKSYSGSATWFDRSGLGSNGTLTNGATFSSTNGGSINFDGINDYVIVPDGSNLDFNGATNLTSEVWIKLNQYKDISFVNAKGDGGGAVVNYNYFFIGTNSSFYFTISDGVTSQNSPVVSPSNLPVGVWGNVCGVLDTDRIRIYLNGVELGSPTVRTINPLSNNFPFYISTTSYALNGNIAISKVYNRALSPTEILKNYNSQKSRFGLL